MNVSELRPLWIPLAVTAVALAVLVVDSLVPPRDEKTVAGNTGGWLVAGALAALLGASFFFSPSGPVLSGAYVADAWTLFLQRLFLAAGVLGVLGAMDDVAARTPDRRGEYWMLLVSSVAGMTLLAGARDLILLTVAFELMGIPLYLLAAWAKTDVDDPLASGRGRRTSEAALKLYLTGATSTALSLFGLGIVTGLAGATRIHDLARVPMTPLGAVGLLLILAGAGFKVGLAPFHMWVPDTYQGARLPFVAFLSVAPKTAGVAAIALVFVKGFGGARDTWIPAVAGLSLLSMGIGNLLAAPQTDLRRMLGYSGVAQLGYALVAVAANGPFAMGTVLFFLSTYVFTNLGAFLVLHANAEATGAHDAQGLEGLGARAPALGLAFMVFLLSLAGIPFAAGFWGKLYVFLAAWRAGLHGLVWAGFVLAVIGLWYYLRALRAAWMTDRGTLPVPKAGAGVKLAVALCVFAVVGFGLWPRPLVESAESAGRALIGHAS